MCLCLFLLSILFHGFICWYLFHYHVLWYLVGSLLSFVFFPLNFHDFTWIFLPPDKPCNTYEFICTYVDFIENFRENWQLKYWDFPSRNIASSIFVIVLLNSFGFFRKVLWLFFTQVLFARYLSSPRVHHVPFPILCNPREPNLVGSITVPLPFGFQLGLANGEPWWKEGRRVKLGSLVSPLNSLIFSSSLLSMTLTGFQ